ncbi:MAG: hypothetical protein ACRED5_18500, partial [Propylenella sp.]
ALGSWMELRFRVEADISPPGATIEVMEGDRHIVTVKGKIGYKYAEPKPAGLEQTPTATKFKIGHYCDYMPFPATLDIDWLRVERAE